MTASDEWRKSPGKKNTRKWCGGHVGREHHTDIFMTKWPYSGVCRIPVDWMKRMYPDRPWRCLHEIRCTVCGKIMRPARWQECPDLPEGLRTPDAGPAARR